MSSTIKETHAVKDSTIVKLCFKSLKDQKNKVKWLY